MCDSKHVPCALMSQKHSDLHNVYVIWTGNILSSSDKNIFMSLLLLVHFNKDKWHFGKQDCTIFLVGIGSFPLFNPRQCGKKILLCPKTHTSLCTSEGIHPLLLRGARLVLSFPKLVNIVCAMAEYARPCNLCNCLKGTSHYGSCIFSGLLP